jgi:predicted MPP superfamily phosphohydrolase
MVAETGGREAVAMRKLIVTLIVALTLTEWAPAGQGVQLPGVADSLKMAVIGDNGNGEKAEYDVGQQMVTARQRFPFELVLMLGDNMYGSQQPQDFVDKFERPYAPLLQAGIPFFAALGNHDKPTNREYKPFNMNGERYYTFARKGVRFVVLDTNLLDKDQVTWADNALRQSTEEWKIAIFHHPLYSDGGRHGSNVELRTVLEPLLVRYGVSVVLSGHEHIYERLKPQQGITYFVEGSSGMLRKGDLNPSPMMAAGFDQDQTFMLVEIAGANLSFQTLSRTGRIVDSGVIARRSGT